MVEKISIIDEDDKNIDADTDNDLVVLRTPDNDIYYLKVDAAKEIIKSLEGQIIMIETKKDNTGE